ncbi:MAG: DotU family type IV/VI secretion system protein, partial [Alphaproteobacteria bacterium]|nr:DotU family type IV/VI secretion system protein [Alphaproteobacteria bacterium]
NTEVEGNVVSIQKKLITIIENITNTILAKSRINPRFVSDIKYIMTVFADEVFLNLRWEGAKFWRYTLLEKQLFQTEIAGDKFFSMLDEIITDFDNSEMAFLYLMTLSLGFKGRYRDMENSEENIGWYKERLYSILNTKSARLYFPGRSHMIESCYEHTYIENNETQLPDYRFWTYCVLSVIFAYILISWFVWAGITNDIGEILSKISEQTRQGASI